MTQYLLLKSDGEADDPRVGLTSDSQADGGVLGGDNYEAAETSHNNYLELQEANSEYVAIDSQLQSSTISGMTVMAWVRSTDTSGEAIISSYDRSEYYRLNLNSGVFDCSFDTSGGGGDFSSGVNVADGRWHHLAIVYDAGEVRMYVDGRRVYTNTGNATEIGSGGSRYGFLGTGSEAESFDGAQGPNSYGNLDISDHRLYLDAKTDAEVEAAFEGNPQTTGLYEYLPLTADDAGRLNDASGNGRHGYLRSGASVIGTETTTSLNTFQTTNTTSASPIGQTEASTLVDQQSSGFSETGPLVFENAEDADFSDWTVNEGTLTADSNQAIGDYSMFHDSFGGDNGAREAVKSVDVPRRVDSFSFMFWETSSNTSAALSFYNSDGQREFSVGTDNPSWAYDDASGNDNFGNPGNYQHWMRFTITFNWSQSQYTVEGEDLQTGYTASHTGGLYHGKDIAEIASGQVNLAGYTGAGQWHLDQMQFNVTETGTKDQFFSSTFGNSSTDTFAGGVTDVFSGTELDATADASALVEAVVENATATPQFELALVSRVVDAVTESFDAIDRTGRPHAFAGVDGGITLATADGQQAFADTLAGVTAAAELASFTSQTSDEFAETFADGLDGNASGTTTVAAGDAAVTALGTVELGLFDGISPTISLYTVASRESATTASQSASVQSEAVPLVGATNAVTTQLTPTTSLVISVDSTETGIEGTFADSLAADVGAQTFIKVAKTRADAEEQTGDLDTFAGADAIRAVGALEDLAGDGLAESDVVALKAAALSETFGASFSGADPLVAPTDASLTDEAGSAFTSASPDAAVRDAVASELEASGDTSATSEALAEAAQALTEQGLADTQTEAAALVSQVAAEDQRTTDEAFAGVEGGTESFDVTDRTGRPTTFTVSDALQSAFSGDGIDSDALAEALPLISATLVSTVQVSGEVSADATPSGEELVTDADVSPIEALFNILYTALEGSNSAIPITEQRIRLENHENYVEVVSG